MSTPVPIKLRARKEIFSHFAKLLEKSGLDRTVTQLWSLGGQGQGAQRLESLATPMYFPRDTQHGPVVESLCPAVLCTQLDGDIWGHPLRARPPPTMSTGEAPITVLPFSIYRTWYPWITSCLIFEFFMSKSVSVIESNAP